MDHVEQLWEIEQIKQLKARYFRFLDTKQWDLYRSTFSDDARVWIKDEAQTDSPTPTYSSIDEFVYTFMKATHDSVSAISVHQGHMPEIEILDEVRARAIWAMFDWVDRKQLGAFQGFGHYYEEYEKGADGRWRIQVLKLTRLRRDDVPTLAGDAPPYGHVPKPWPR
jgi:hypothetical protein